MPSDPDFAEELFAAARGAPPPYDRPAPPEGLPACYSCEHGASNVPCICHYAVAMALNQAPPQVVEDDWHIDVADGGGGMTDKLVK